MNITITDAKKALDKIISKARVHLYKPIQIAEILYHDRVNKNIDLSNLDTYRNASKKWRDIVCIRFLGRTSSSSARYQDDIFNDNAIPPRILAELGKENCNKDGIVEAYIYKKFQQRFNQVSSGLDYCETHDVTNFILNDFLNLFWKEPGLRRSIDKIYEIVVYALFSALIDALEVSVEVGYNTKNKDIFTEFQDFASSILNLSLEKPLVKYHAVINRLGITNAADKGLDMWANFGLAIQIKHLSLTEELAENIVSSLSSDRIVIVCKDSEKKIILSLLNQIGWKAKIQSIVTEKELIAWYHKALCGEFSHRIGHCVLERIQEQVQIEFPVTNHQDFSQFMDQRGYHHTHDEFWK